MNMMMKTLPFAVLLALSACQKQPTETKPEDKPPVAGETKPAATPSASSGDVIKIGSGAPKTGTIAHLGKDNENGVKLAIDEINAQGGVDVGGKKMKLEMIGEDDASDPKQGTTIAQKMVDVGVVGVIGHLNSGVSMPASTIYAQAGVTQISPSSTNPDYTAKSTKTPKGSVSAYRVVASDVLQGGSIAKVALKKGMKTVAILDDATQYGKGLADQFSSAATAGGAKVTGREALTDKTTDFKSALTKLRAANPDYIFWGGMDTTAGALAKQMKELGLKSKLLAGDGACTEEFIKLAGDAAEGTLCSLAGAPVETLPKGKEFLAAYDKAFAGQKVQIYSPFSYAATYALVEAIKIAKSTDREAIAAAMPKVSIDSVIGPVAFDEKGDIKGAMITVKEIKDKKLVVLEIIK